MQQPFDNDARKALEATGLLTAEEVTLIIGRRKRAASRAAVAASLENTALLPTQEKPAEKLTAVERSLQPPPPSPGVEKRAAVAEAEDRLSDTLAKMALGPSNARAPAVLEVGTPVSFKLSDGSVRRGVVEKVHNEGAAYTLVEDGSGVRWQHHPARSLKARSVGLGHHRRGERGGGAVLGRDHGLEEHGEVALVGGRRVPVRRRRRRGVIRPARHDAVAFLAVYCVVRR